MHMQETETREGAPNLSYGWTGIAAMKSVHA